MAPSPLNKQTAGYNSLHAWLISLGMDLAVCRICGSENGTSVHYSGVFSVDVAFACHFVATCLLSTPPPPTYKSAGGIGYTSKQLPKMAGN